MDEQGHIWRHQLSQLLVVECTLTDVDFHDKKFWKSKVFHCKHVYSTHLPDCLFESHTIFLNCQCDFVVTNCTTH